MLCLSQSNYVKQLMLEKFYFFLPFILFPENDPNICFVLSYISNGNWFYLLWLFSMISFTTILLYLIVLIYADYKYMIIDRVSWNSQHSTFNETLISFVFKIKSH